MTELKMAPDEYLQLVEWMRDPERKAANEEFTTGAARDAAYAFEDFLSHNHARQSAGDLRDQLLNVSPLIEKFLLPCPFCDGEPRIRKKHAYHIECRCGVHMIGDRNGGKDYIIDKWNDRS